MDRSSIPAKSPAAVARIIDGEAVIVEPRNGLVNVVNAAGSRIWELADGKRTVEEIGAAIREEYGIDEETALKDALEFLNDMESKGLIAGAASGNS